MSNRHVKQIENSKPHRLPAAAKLLVDLVWFEAIKRDAGVEWTSFPSELRHRFPARRHAWAAALPGGNRRSSGPARSGRSSTPAGRYADEDRGRGQSPSWHYRDNSRDSGSRGAYVAQDGSGSRGAAPAGHQDGSGSRGAYVAQAFAAGSGVAQAAAPVPAVARAAAPVPASEPAFSHSQVNQMIVQAGALIRFFWVLVWSVLSSSSYSDFPIEML